MAIVLRPGARCSECMAPATHARPGAPAVIAHREGCTVAFELEREEEALRRDDEGLSYGDEP
jgi:hypothetical protein